MRIEAQVQYVDGSQSGVAVYGAGLYASSPYVTPNTIYQRYNVPLGTRGLAPGNSQSVTAFEDQFISVDGDLRGFFADMGMPYQQPIMDGNNDPTQPGGESTLDIQYIMVREQRQSENIGGLKPRVPRSLDSLLFLQGVAPGIPTTFVSLSADGPEGSGGPAKPPGNGQRADREDEHCYR